MLLELCHVSLLYRPCLALYFALFRCDEQNELTFRYEFYCDSSAVFSSVKYLHVCMYQSVVWGANVPAKGADCLSCILIIYCDNLECHSMVTYVQVF